jgi:hypothetical protein
MRLADLNPQMTGAAEGLNDLMLDCPLCKRRFVVRCRLGGPVDAQQRAEDALEHIWAWHADAPGWDHFTLEPSIQNHPVDRKSPPCPAHFCITKGEIYFV